MLDFDAVGGLGLGTELGTLLHQHQSSYGTIEHGSERCSLPWAWVLLGARALAWQAKG